jgi:hypothetical protein
VCTNIEFTEGTLSKLNVVAGYEKQQFISFVVVDNNFESTEVYNNFDVDAI